MTLLVLFQIVLAVTFGSFVYYMDLNEEKREIKTIPEGIWWAIITMTTVGYGDVVPVILNSTITYDVQNKSKFLNFDNRLYHPVTYVSKC